MSLATRLLGANPGVQVSSALSGSLTTPGAKGTFDAYPGTFWSIATATVSGSNATEVVISNIPQDFKHLQLRGLTRSPDSGTGQDTCSVEFNGDTTSGNYDGRTMYAVNGYRTAGSIYCFARPKQSTQTDLFSAGILDIYDYSSSSHYKTARYEGGFRSHNTNDTWIYNNTGFWLNTAPITSIRIVGSMVPKSTFALYGIK